MLDSCTQLHQEIMSAKSTASKLQGELFDTGSGHVFADNSGQQGTGSVKSKVDFIYGAVPSRSKNDILLVLQSVDYNVEAAISMFARGEDQEVLKTWSFQGKKPKNGNSKKKRNKKKQGVKEDSVEIEEKSGSDQSKQQSTNDEPLTCTSMTKDAAAVECGLSLDLKRDENVSSASLLPPSPSSSDTSGLSDQATASDECQLQVDHPSKPHPMSMHRGAKKQAAKQDSVASTPSVSPHHESLKKTVKDLLRSTFSLARYQVMLEEECEASLKRIAKSFETLRKCLDERQAVLVEEMDEFKTRSVHLLEERIEDASALKLKAERVGSMSDEQVALLRADMKNFVSQRKLDEELAQTTRFVGDEESMLKHIRNYGEVVPIKNHYTPVILNHTIDHQPHKLDVTNHPKGHALSAATPSTTTTSSTTACPVPTTVISTNTAPTLANTASTAPTSAEMTNAAPAATAMVSTVPTLADSAAAMVNVVPTSSASPGVLQETAEMHVRLKQVLQQQGINNHEDTTKQGARNQQSAKPRDNRPRRQTRSRDRNHHSQHGQQKQQDQHATRSQSHRDQHAPRPQAHRDQHVPRSQSQQDQHAPRPQTQKDQHAPLPQVQHDQHAPRPQSHRDQHAPRSQAQHDQHAPRPQSHRDQHAPQPQAQQDQHAPRPQANRDQHAPRSQSKQDQHAPRPQSQKDQHTPRPQSSRHSVQRSHEERREKRVTEEQNKPLPRQQEEEKQRPARDRRRQRDRRPRTVHEGGTHGKGSLTQNGDAASRDGKKHPEVNGEGGSPKHERGTHGKGSPTQNGEVSNGAKKHPEVNGGDKKKAVHHGKSAEPAKLEQEGDESRDAVSPRAEEKPGTTDDKAPEALPQRQQNRRRNHGRGERDRGNHGNRQPREEHHRQVNGASNGLNHSTENEEQDKAARNPRKNASDASNGLNHSENDKQHKTQRKPLKNIPAIDTAEPLTSANGNDVAVNKIDDSSAKSDQNSTMNGFIADPSRDECLVER